VENIHISSGLLLFVIDHTLAVSDGISE